MRHPLLRPLPSTLLLMFHRLTHNRFRPGKMATLGSLNFDNLALRSLPIDPETQNFTRSVKGACFSKTTPEPVAKPETVALSLPALRLLDLDDKESEKPEFAEYFAGNKLLPGAETAAHCYCGHQFGYFSGQLGDGAAMYLGEVVNSAGERWEIQLKGAGPTPYSRQSDGRKVLRSTIREFLCSEAMHHLGIPTTRAGSCVTSDTKIVRDIFYSGNPIRERATLVLRIAPTFFRFGSFEIFKPLDRMTGRGGPSVGRKDVLEQMLEYVIKTFFPEIYDQHKDNAQERYLAFYREVIKLTAQVVAGWQCVGFCHGVLNTDNMSILGLTIDYGPYGFLDAYNPDHICNTSDDGGRYTYVKQPAICRWNLEKLAEALAMALPVDLAKAELGLYDEEYEKSYMRRMRNKLGLLKKELPEDKELVQSFLDTMYQTQSDFTNSFRCLSRFRLPGCKDADDDDDAVVEYLLTQCSTADELKKSMKPRMDGRELQMMMMLMQMNPDLLQQLGGGHMRLMKELERMEKAKELENLTREEKTQTDKAKWEAWLSSYRGRLAKETDGLDGESALKEFSQKRVETMNASNPRFILRNYIAQNAIEAAEKGDFSEVQRVLKLLETPYSDTVDLGNLATSSQSASSASTDEDAGASSSVGSSSQPAINPIKGCAGLAYDGRPPQWAAELRVT
ncbi:protein adenylyltransferase SelO, mitochondrial-like [Patiria miniata]|uniref:Selenoprotein O n=1 Tax=Patiria miniata TaxID=46514 RepID=A0A913Z3V9_PATMI|nr:protein adenylyltransferase SelO, mitochondrial-like [Patiria miniata]XP_038046392.1 protein adenylyltransferase SelO, mitochondrial-like [Patiria miniata]